jgi:SecD/SecF fusion protein
MILFYNKAGWVASIVLIANIFFLFGVLVSFGAVLTLPGIAGILLTMGMALDTNIIIYERVKEELRGGSSLSAAIDKGYGRALSAIIDFNVTSLITGIVLFIFGTGPVQGFATTLIIGIVTSFFTSLMVTRLIFSGMLRRERKITFSNKVTENFLANTKIDFMGKRKIAYAVSAALILTGITSLFVQGLNFGVDFTGGRTYVVQFDRPVTDGDVRAALGETFIDDAMGSVAVTQWGATALQQQRITVQYMHDRTTDDANTLVETMLFEALRPLFAEPITFAEFQSTDINPNGIISSDMVGPSVARDITRNSFIAVFFSLIAIGAYIFFRFRKWEYGVSSVIALGIDALLTVGAFSLLYRMLPFNMEVNQSFIAAILTIIGYSINDKVVIFDRIREYRRLYPKRKLRNTLNDAVNSTLSRTINTSGSTLVTLIAIFFFGGEVIRGFIFALIFGIFISTLSSIFTSTPIAYDLMRRGEEKAEKEEKAAAKAEKSAKTATAKA